MLKTSNWYSISIQAKIQLKIMKIFVNFENRFLSTRSRLLLLEVLPETVFGPDEPYPIKFLPQDQKLVLWLKSYLNLTYNWF